MIDNPFKTWFAIKCNKPVQQLAKWGVHPDALTWLGFLISSLSFIFILRDRPMIALCTWWLGRLLDGLDGMLARALNKQSQRGGFLDINLDMAAYGLIAIGFMLKTEWYLIWALILFGYILCITSALSLGQMQDLKSNKTLGIAAGLAEAGETGIFYSCMLIFPNYGKSWCIIWLGIISVTIISRFIQAYKKG